MSLKRLKVKLKALTLRNVNRHTLNHRVLPRLHLKAIVQPLSYLLLTLVIFAMNIMHAVAANDQKVLLRVATAANFAPVLKLLTPQIEQSLNVKLQVISASSGTLFQQIKHGAPFDVFLSADKLHPQKLVDEQLAIAKTLTTYTQGQLSFYSAKHPRLTFDKFASAPTGYQRIAIANPDIAPYGKATKSLLSTNNLWNHVSEHLVTGINVGQTFQQIRSKAVDFGFVATSQLVLNNIITSDHKPLKIDASWLAQQGVVIARSSIKNQARHFIQYLSSPAIQAQLVELGYIAVDNAMADENDS